MATERQQEANRRNAQLSTGPKTQEGKDKVRVNAITHGLRAEAFDVLPNEDPEKFAASLDAWNRELAPTSEVEAQLVRHVAVVLWKRERADRYENASMSRRIRDAVMECDAEDAQAINEAAALASFDPSSDGERFRRYQLSLQRDFFRTLDMISKIRAQNSKMKQEEIIANEPNREVLRSTSRIQEPGTPNKANSPAPNKANSPAPNKANPVPAMPVSSGSVAKRTSSPNFDQWPNIAKTIGWLDISCEKV